MKRLFFDKNVWREKVDTVFVEYWRAQKDLKLAGFDGEKWKKAFDEMGKASRLLHKKQLKTRPSKYALAWKEIIRPLDGEVWPGHGEPGKAYTVNPESSAFFRDLVFLKFGITFRELISQVETDRAAHDKLLRIHREYYRFRWTAHGFTNLRLKFNLNHFNILVQGMDYGLDRLNEVRLAYCLDEICPCAQRHSSEYLRNFRREVIKACKRLLEAKNKPTSFDTPNPIQHS